MGIKRCPSFSKRPGFPCGLRVLLLDGDSAARCHTEALLKECSYEVTPCATPAEALSRLSGACSFDVLLADTASLGDGTSVGAASSRDSGAGAPCSSDDSSAAGSSSSCGARSLLDGASGLPCIFMAPDPSPSDIMAGIQQGAVDFLAKPLSLSKLRNIWQHTVRKMMCNMSLDCSADAAAAGEAAAAGAPAPAAPGAGDAPAPAAPAPAPGGSGSSSGSPKVLNYSNAPNLALAVSSSFYEPSSKLSLSRSGSTALTAPADAGASDSPASRPAKQQHTVHGPVRSCPSTRSLNSMASCQSTQHLSLPGSPSSPSLAKQGSGLSPEPDSGCEDPASCNATAAACAGRCLKKAVRHGSPAAATPAVAVGKPPLASKPPTGQQQAAAPAPAAPAPAAPASEQQQAAPAAAAAAAPAAGPLPLNGLTSVPLPSGLGPLPTGMVWGMPMVPLARAPGIVPPGSGGNGGSANGAAAAAAALPPLAPWGGAAMCGAMPGAYGGAAAGYGMAGPGYGPMAAMQGAYAAGMPAGAMAMPGLGSMGGYGGYGSCAMMGGAPWDAAWGVGAAPQLCDAAPAQGAALPRAGGAQQPGPRTRSRSKKSGGGRAAPRSGAAAAAALHASFGADAGCGPLTPAAAPSSAAAAAAAAVAMDCGEEGFDFMLGDVAAEDDLDDVCGGLLDGELAALEQHGLRLPSELPELDALHGGAAAAPAGQPQLQQAQQLGAAAGRASLDCRSGHHSTRVSFDCSTASTMTGARLSFEASTCCAPRGGASNRVSFEVSCCNSGAAPGAAAASAQASLEAAAGLGPCGAGNLASAASASAGLLGSMTDLFAACSGDSCSEGSAGGMARVDSCGLLADLQSMFAASGGAEPADERGAAAGGAGSLLDDVMEELPLELAMKKSSSLAELINAGLPGFVQ